MLRTKTLIIHKIHVCIWMCPWICITEENKYFSLLNLPDWEFQHHHGITNEDFEGVNPFWRVEGQ